MDSAEAVLRTVDGEDAEGAEQGRGDGEEEEQRVDAEEGGAEVPGQRAEVLRHQPVVAAPDEQRERHHQQPAQRSLCQARFSTFSLKQRNFSPSFQHLL